MLHICCHLDDHTAELNEVGNEKVDDVDQHNMITSHLQENISKNKQAVVNNRETNLFLLCQLPSASQQMR